MKFGFMVINLLNWFCFVILQQKELAQCVIVQDKMSISTPPTPPFLSQHKTIECQIHGAEGEGMLRCGKSAVYIKPGCVCSFHNVYEAVYHQYSSCPQGEKSDAVTQLKCPDCKNYSLNNEGPCINGGKLTCNGDEVAPEIICECPPHYKGIFCEDKMENVTRLCDRIPNYTADTLQNCDVTKGDCVTYSRNMRYAFKCYETDASQERGGLPLCIDTEDITMSPAVTDVTYSIVPGDTKTVGAKSRNFLGRNAFIYLRADRDFTNITIVRFFYYLGYYVGHNYYFAKITTTARDSNTFFYTYMKPYRLIFQLKST